VFSDGGVSVLNRWHYENCISFKSPLTEEKAAMLLPIVLDRDAASAPPAAQCPPAECTIEVVIGDACVRIRGTADAAMLRAVFQSLRS
jgi:hypothetical protein